MEYRQDALIMRIPRSEVKDLMEFKMEISREWLAVSVKNKRPSTHDSSSSTEDNPELMITPCKTQNYRAPIPPDHKLKDKYVHWPVVDGLKTARNRRKKNCGSRTRVRCSKCNIYLCMTAKNTCFKEYHI